MSGNELTSFGSGGVVAGGGAGVVVPPEVGAVEPDEVTGVFVLLVLVDVDGELPEAVTVGDGGHSVLGPGAGTLIPGGKYA